MYAKDLNPDDPHYAKSVEETLITEMQCLAKPNKINTNSCTICPIKRSTVCHYFFSITACIWTMKRIKTTLSEPTEGHGEHARST